MRTARIKAAVSSTRVVTREGAPEATIGSSSSALPGAGGGVEGSEEGVREGVEVSAEGVGEGGEAVGAEVG
jgi:hypothetical protein